MAYGFWSNRQWRQYWLDESPVEPCAYKYAYGGGGSAPYHTIHYANRLNVFYLCWGFAGKDRVILTNNPLPESRPCALCQKAESKRAQPQTATPGSR